MFFISQELKFLGLVLHAIVCARCSLVIVSPNLILTTTLWSSYYYYSHFRDAETGAQLINKVMQQRNDSVKSQSQGFLLRDPALS